MMAQVLTFEAEEGMEAPMSGDDLGRAVVKPEVMKIDGVIEGEEPEDSSEGSPVDSDCQALVVGRVPWPITRSGRTRQWSVTRIAPEKSFVRACQIWDGASVSGHLVHGDRIPQQLGQLHEVSGPGNGHSRHSLRWISPRKEFFSYVRGQGKKLF